MRRAEKNFRKIKCCRIAFSPEAAIWIRRVQVYYSILRFHRKKKRIAAISNAQPGDATSLTHCESPSKKLLSGLRHARRSAYFTANMARDSGGSI